MEGIVGCHRRLGLEARKLYKITWTKGHATDNDVEENRCTEWGRKANDHADHFAVLASQWAKHRWPNDGEIVRYNEAIDWYKWLPVFIGNWDAKDADIENAKAAREAKAEEAKRKRDQRKTESRLHKESPHALVTTFSLAWCLLCRRTARTTRVRAALRRSRCCGYGPGVGELAESDSPCTTHGLRCAAVRMGAWPGEGGTGAAGQRQ